MNPQLYSTAEQHVPSKPSEVDATKYIELLSDERVREILAALGDDPLTTSELADRTTLPISTLYRRLAALSDTHLVEESVRLHPNGKHSTQYARSPCNISVSVSEEITVSIEPGDSSKPTLRNPGPDHTRRH